MINITIQKRINFDLCVYNYNYNIEFLLNSSIKYAGEN